MPPSESPEEPTRGPAAKRFEALTHEPAKNALRRMYLQQVTDDDLRVLKEIFGAPVWAENSDARFAFGLRLLVDGIAAHTRADV